MDLPQIIFSSASAQCQWWQLSFLVNQSFLWVFLCYLTDWPLCFWGVFHQAYTTIIPHSFSSCPEIYLCCDLDKELKVDFVYWLVSTMLMIIISLLFDAPTLCYIHLLFLAVFTETPWKNISLSVKAVMASKGFGSGSWMISLFHFIVERGLCPSKL